MYKYNYPISEKQPTQQQRSLLESINLAEQIKVNLSNIVAQKQAQYDFLVNTTSDNNNAKKGSLIDKIKKKVNFERSEMSSNKKCFCGSSKTGSSGKPIKSNSKNSCTCKSKSNNKSKTHRMLNEKSIKSNHKSVHHSQILHQRTDQKTSQNPQELLRKSNKQFLEQSQDLCGFSNKVDEQIYSIQYPKFTSIKRQLSQKVSQFQQKKIQRHGKQTKTASFVSWQQKIELLQQLQKVMHLNLQLQNQNKKLKSIIKQYKNYITFIQDLNTQLKQEIIFWISKTSDENYTHSEHYKPYSYLRQSSEDFKKGQKIEKTNKNGQNLIIKDEQLLKFLSGNKQQNIQLKLKKHNNEYYWSVKRSDQNQLEFTNLPIKNKIDQQIDVKIPFNKHYPYSQTQMKKLMNQLSLLKEKGIYQRNQIVNLKLLKQAQANLTNQSTFLNHSQNLKQIPLVYRNPSISNNTVQKTRSKTQTFLASQNQMWNMRSQLNNSHSYKQKINQRIIDRTQKKSTKMQRSKTVTVTKQKLQYQ